MPAIPVSSPLSYVGVFLLISGFFLVVAGLNIIRIEKITVKPGSKTWGFGIILVVFGAVFLLPEIVNSFTQHPTPTPTATLSVSLTNTPAQEIPRTSEPEPVTDAPTIEPTATPTIEPTATPTVEPTATPTVEPTATPTVEPTNTPTVESIDALTSVDVAICTKSDFDGSKCRSTRTVLPSDTEAV